MKRDEFEKLISEIGKGFAVDQEELVDALCYAGGAWYEIQQLCKQLCAGYRAQQKDIQRKDTKIEVYLKLNEALRRENRELKERLGIEADNADP